MKQLSKWPLISCFIILIVCIVLPACSGGTTTPTNTSGNTNQQVGIVNIGTHAIGTYYNILGTALGKTIEGHTSMKAKVIPLSGPVAWMPMMLTKEMDIGLCNSTDAFWGYFANQDTFSRISKGKGFPLRLIMVATGNDVSIAVPNNSGIKSLKDLKGKRIAGGFTAAPSCQLQMLAALANVGLTGNDVKLVPVAGPAPAVRAVIDGQADASGTVTTGMPEFAELEAAVGATILPFDTSPEAKARALEQYPIGWFQQQKGGVYPGIAVDGWFLHYENYVVCREDMPENAVYDILNTMWDNYKETFPIHIKFVEWTPDTFTSKMQTVPYHPGAIKFFKEKGVWTPEMEKTQQSLLAKTVPSFK